MVSFLLLVSLSLIGVVAWCAGYCAGHRAKRR
jgi:hypothetical protein